MQFTTTEYDIFHYTVRKEEHTNMVDTTKGIEKGIVVFNLILVAGFLGLVWLIIYGNLSGNLGFATGTTGANNTEAVIDNLTSGVTTFFGFSVTWFTIIALVILITILLSLLALAVTILKMVKSKDGGFAD